MLRAHAGERGGKLLSTAGPWSPGNCRVAETLRKEHSLQTTEDNLRIEVTSRLKRKKKFDLCVRAEAAERHTAAGVRDAIRSWSQEGHDFGEVG